jgi:hypothetical protein
LRIWPTVVLHEYFQETPEGWTNHRADMEIEHFRSKVEQASKAGKASAERRRNGRSTDVQPTNNQEPITNNQKPVTKETRKRVDPPADVGQQVWADWFALRKAKRAPVTATVIEGARKEAAKAGMTLEEFLKVWCQRGSQGLQADWLKPNERNQSKSFAQQEREMGWKRWEEMTGRQHPDRLAHESKSHGQVIELDGGNFLEIEQ